MNEEALIEWGARMRGPWSARQYLREVWGYERIEDVDPLTWDCIRENTEEEGSEERYPLDHILMRAKRIFGDSEDGLWRE